MGLKKEQIDKIINLYGGTSEYTDGQGFITPERFEEIKAGFGESYGAGYVMKPAYYHIEDNGTGRMLKYSTIVLTDDLVKDNPILKGLRDKMQAKQINEVVFSSGNKVGIPETLTNRESILSEKGEFNDDSMFMIDNKDYRLQLNPTHDALASVANPSQLSYFLNTLEDTSSADVVYGALSNIISNRLVDEKANLTTNKDLAKAILNKLKSGRNNENTYEIMKELYDDSKIIKPWDFPSISAKTLTQLTAHVKTSVSVIRFPGSKAVLQTAFGTEGLDKETLELRDSLSYNHEKLEGYKDKDVMYAESIFPKGLLPAEVEAEVERQIKETEVRDEEGNIIKHGYYEGEFLTPDALGFRLPSSDLHSAVPLRIKGFYDSKGTNVIIAPKEIVNLHGSDYDVDALFMLIREYEKDSNGNRTNVPIGYKKDSKGRYYFDSDFLKTDEFKELSTAVKEKYYMNQIVEELLDVASREDNRERMSKPITMKFIKDDIAEIESLRGIDNVKDLDLSNFEDRQLVHSSSHEASTGVGIWANGIKVIAFLQRSNNGKSPVISSELSESDKQKVALNIEGKWKLTLSNDEKMYEVLDGFLNTTIDNVKEQDLPKLNLTSNNIRAYIALMAFGVDMKMANRMFAQNSIEDANKNNRNLGLQKALVNRAYLKSVNKFVLNPINKAAIKSFPTDTSNIVLNKSDLEWALKSGFSTKELLKKSEQNKELTAKELKFLRIQSVNLRELNKADSIGKQFSTLTKILNLAKETPVFKHEIDEAYAAFEALFTKVSDNEYEQKPFIVDMPDLMKTLPHIKSLIDVLEFEKKKIEESFIKYNESLFRIIKSKISSIDPSFDDHESINEDKKLDDFIKFVNNSIRWDPQYNGFENEEEYVSEDKYRNKFYYTGADAFQKRFVDKVRLLKEMPALQRNIFVKSIQISRNAAGEETVIFPPGENMDFEDIIDFQNAFDELKNYKFEKGKIIKKILTPIEDIRNVSEEEKEKYGEELRRSMEYSMLQKDFLRYLIVKNGLTYSPDSYIEIVPSRMKRLFQRAFERALYNPKDGFLNDAMKINQLAEIYRLNLAVNKPDNIKEVSISKNGIVRNENTLGEKYTYLEKDAEGHYLFADLTFKMVEDSKGNISVKASKRRYPLFIRSAIGKTKAGRTKLSVYRRVDVNHEKGLVMYQRVGSNNLVNKYSSVNLKNVNYEVELAYNSGIPTFRTSTPSNPELSTVLELDPGTVVAFVEYSDTARISPKYYVVKSSKKVKGKYEYEFEKTKEPEFEVSNAKKDEALAYDILGNRLHSKPGESVGTVSEILGKIKIATPRLEGIANMLLRLQSTQKNYIFSEDLPSRTLGTQRTKQSIADGRLEFRNNVYIDLNKIITAFADLELTADQIAETILHEELHRYTHTIIQIDRMLKRSKEFKTKQERYAKLKEFGFTNDEVLFLERAQSLFTAYMRNGDKSSKYYKLIKNSKSAQIDEFISYGLTKKDFINELKQIKTSKSGKSLFESLISIITKLFKGDMNLYTALYASFDSLTMNDASTIENSVIKLSEGLSEEARTELSDMLIRTQMSKALRTVSLESILFDMSNSVEGDAFTQAEVLYEIAQEYPEYASITNMMLKMNKDLTNRIENSKVIDDEGKRRAGATKIGIKNGSIFTSVLVDAHYINSLSKDPVEARAELATTIIHEEIHRFTAVVEEAQKAGVKLKSYESKFLNDLSDFMDDLSERVYSDMKNGSEAAILIHEVIGNDISELIAYGLSNREIINYLKRIQTEVPGMDMHEKLLDITTELFAYSKTDAESVLSRMVQADAPLEETTNPETTEDLQRSVLKCGA